MSKGTFLYPVPKTWKLLSIDQIRSPEKSSCVSGPFGSKIASKYFVDEGVPVIRGNNIRADLTRFVPNGFVFVSESRANEYRPQHVKGGDLVFTCWGTIGQVGLIPEDGPFDEYIISNKQLKLRVDRSIADPLFCFYQLASQAGVSYIRNRGIGGAVPGINLGILKAIPIAFPSLEIQKRIASILTAYDDLIENNRRRMALLEESARLLYREWFAHLRFPGHEHTRISNGIPKGWKRLLIGDLIEQGAMNLQTGPFGTQLRASDYTEEGTPVINVRNIGYGILRPDKLEYVPDEIAERLSVHILQTDDIVFGRKGAVDRHLLISPAQDGWMQGSDCIRMRPLSPKACPVLFSFAFREPEHHDWMLTQCGNKATMASLNQGVIARLPALIPAESVLNEFQSLARNYLDQIAILAQQTQKLKTARDLLLPKLMSGEIVV